MTRDGPNLPWIRYQTASPIVYVMGPANPVVALDLSNPLYFDWNLSERVPRTLAR